MRGRDAEWTLVDGLLRRVRVGGAGVLLVEGEAGMGKSLLLSEAARAASGQGFSLIKAEAHELERLIPLCPLLVGLSEAVSKEVLADIPADNSGSQMMAIANVREQIRILAGSGPVLVTVDDVQFADPTTLLALRLLPRQLSGSAVGWVLARSPERGSDVESLFSLLAKEGATEIVLGGLSEDAIVGLVADLTGSAPGRELLAMLGGVGGNPMLIREFIEGLREERLLRMAGGRDVVPGERVPSRVYRALRRQTSGLRPEARQLLEAGAMLGQSFAVVDVAEMLGQPPVAVMAAVDDAMAAGILIANGDVLSFRDTLAWRAVSDAIPEPVARALHLQFAEILLDRGSVLPAAEYLLKGAWRGDRRELSLLTSAAAELIQASPKTAADLAVRSLELTDAADPAWVERSLIATRSLAAARRFDEAVSITEASLSRPLTAAEQGEFRCGLASIYNMTGRPDRARTESEWVLARGDLPDRAHQEASRLLLRALAGLPDQQQAEDRAQAILAARAERGAGEVTAAVTVLAGLRWAEGRVMEALRLYREAVSGEWLAASGALRPLGAQLDLASRLIDIRELDEAKALVDAPVEDVSMVSVAESQTRPALLRARIHLAEGRLDLAADQARAALIDAPDADDCSYNVVARCLLGSIALRRGRQHECESWLEQVPAGLAGPDAGPLGVSRSTLAALAMEERDGPRAALQPIAWLYDQIRKFRWLLLSDPGVAPWLVRIALAAGDQRRAELANAEACELGRINGAFPAVAASGRHAAGLFSGQAEPLEDAVQTQPDVWARASAAEDLGVLLTTADHTGDAVARLEQAQDGYSQLGAMRDMARVRHRLRILGVVHRHWSPAQPGPADGLAGLTPTEAGIAELVARGLTNRQIADQAFVSTHTVAFHLRQIYRKLGVASRVELARLVLAAQRDAGAAGAANGHRPAS